MRTRPRSKSSSPAQSAETRATQVAGLGLPRIDVRGLESEGVVGPSRGSDGGVRDARAVELDRRVSWDRGFAVYDPTASDPTNLKAVMVATGKDEGRCRALIAHGDMVLGLPSYEARAREAVREMVSRGGGVDGVEVGNDLERKSLEVMVGDRAKALGKARGLERAILSDAVSQHAAEVKVVRAVRTTAVSLLRTETHLLTAALSLAAELERDVAEKRVVLKPREKVMLIRDVASIVKATAETVKLAVMTERLILGRPLDVLGGKSSEISNMTDAEAETYIELALRARERKARNAAAIDVLDDEDELSEELGL